MSVGIVLGERASVGCCSLVQALNLVELRFGWVWQGVQKNNATQQVVGLVYDRHGVVLSWN